MLRQIKHNWDYVNRLFIYATFILLVHSLLPVKQRINRYIICDSMLLMDGIDDIVS